MANANINSIVQSQYIQQRVKYAAVSIPNAGCSRTGVLNEMKKTTSSIRKIASVYYDKLDDFINGDFIQIEPTTRCNLACPACIHKDGVPVHDLSFETLGDIFGRHRKIREIKFSGLGEPFLHPEFAEIVELASMVAPVMVFTNGMHINWDALKYISAMNISIDTLCLKKSKLIKGNTYDMKQVLSNLIYARQLKRIGAIPTTLGISFTHTAFNDSDTELIQELCEMWGLVFHYERFANWCVPSDARWGEMHEAALQERGICGAIKPRKDDNCVWLTRAKYYYDALGRRHPCHWRMRYDMLGTAAEVTGCCDTCPD